MSDDLKRLMELIADDRVPLDQTRTRVNSGLRRPRGRRRATLLVAASAAAVCLLATGAFVLLQQPVPTAQPVLAGSSVTSGSPKGASQSSPPSGALTSASSVSTDALPPTSDDTLAQPAGSSDVMRATGSEELSLTTTEEGGSTSAEVIEPVRPSRTDEAFCFPSLSSVKNAQSTWSVAFDKPFGSASLRPLVEACQDGTSRNGMKTYVPGTGFSCVDADGSLIVYLVPEGSCDEIGLPRALIE